MFGNQMKHCLVFASLISPSKMILFEKKYQTFDTVSHHQMKHLEFRQKYSAARPIFNSLLCVSSGDETLHLMFDILLQIWWHVNLHCVPHNISQFSLLVCCRFMYSSSLNTPLRVVFSTLFSVFHLVMKHCISCLIYYLKNGCNFLYEPCVKPSCPPVQNP